MTKEIVSFIRKRFNHNSSWMTGNCYYFSLILKDRFPGGKIIYDPKNCHFQYLFKDKCYDYLGAHKIPDKFYVFNELKSTNYSLYHKIKEECIL